VKAFLNAYGSFLMLPGWLPSLLLLGASLLDFQAGVAAWPAMLSAWLSRRLLPLPPAAPGLDLVNALLVGHLLAATYAPGPALVILVVASGPLVVLVNQALRSRLSRPLCASFVLVGLALMSVARSLLLLPAAHAPFNGYGYLCALGGIFLVPNPVSGALVTVALALGSRYLLILSGLAWAASWAMLLALGVPTNSFTQVLAGTQAILTAVMVGGLWLSPGRASLVLSLLAATATSLVYLALVPLLAPLGIPPLALPFLLTTWLTLWAFAPQNQGFWRFQKLLQPAPPETTWERCTLAQSRGLDPNSLALRPPFRGTWNVYQGSDGPHTHQGIWRHALDFVQLQQGQAYAQDGHQLSDFYCYGAEILSPLAGVVVGMCSDCPDNLPGEVNLDNRWGNYLLIQEAGGLVVMLAHLQPGSLTVGIGSPVSAGQLLAGCGNSGRSPQPHLHMHVQASAVPGSATLPFHLSHLLHQGEYQLDCRPQAGASLHNPDPDQGPQLGLHLPVGRTLRYRVGEKIYQYQVELDLHGQFWLCSPGGARVAFVETPQLLAFYERSGAKDQVLDALTLALGLTPLTVGEATWRDRPPARLTGGLAWRRNLHSHYRRTQEGQGWLQHADHDGYQSWVRLDPTLGPIEFGLRSPGKQPLCARLDQLGLKADEGIPGWNLRLAPAV